jgi:hypothetical protein
VRYKDNNDAAYGADSLPSLFSAYDAVLFGPREWVTEDMDCLLKAEMVLLLIREVLLFIPIE